MLDTLRRLFRRRGSADGDAGLGERERAENELRRAEGDTLFPGRGAGMARAWEEQVDREFRPPGP